MMQKTLLLCFIHGFKGGDDTFGTFPENLRALLSHALPKINIQTIVYPQFETRGDLAECVVRFREWLQNKVIDIEVANHAPSPTVDPTVRTVLVGHSMGGIVAADTLIALAGEKLIGGSRPSSSSSAASDKDDKNSSSFMFPYIQGVLAFDTPYLGIEPGVVAHGAEGHYNTAQSALTQLSGLSGMFWGGSAAATEEKKSEETEKAVAAIEASPAPTTTSAWQKWGKIAMYAAGAGAVAAGGAAAYMKRDQITEGWTWIGSHLEFVGCLIRGEELKKRVANVIKISKQQQVGFANLYTRLGKAAQNKDGSMVGQVIGNRRTFCNLPQREAKAYFEECINDQAKDEISAHQTMFFPKENPGYYALSELAVSKIAGWLDNEWYHSSSGGQKTMLGEL